MLITNKTFELNFESYFSLLEINCEMENKIII